MPTPMDVVCAVHTTFRYINEITLKDQNSKQVKQPRRRIAWQPPENGFLKINFDGSFAKEGRTGACGFLIRDHSGEPVLAGAANISPAMDALAAESAACLFALEAAERVGISRVTLETDCSQLCEAITTDVRDLAPCGMIFRTIS